MISLPVPVNTPKEILPLLQEILRKATDSTVAQSIVGPLLLNDGTVSAPAYSFNADTNTGMYRIGSDILGFTTGGVERLRIDASGNVGIANNNPLVALDVTGTVSASSVLRSGDGTAASPSITFTSNTTSGMYRIGLGILGLATNGIERLRIQSDGGIQFPTLVPSLTTPPRNTLWADNIVKGRINFDGTGTLSIKGSYNVSSLVDDGVGAWTINWGTAFANANYSVTGTSIHQLYVTTGNDPPDHTTTATQVHASNLSGTLTDSSRMEIIAIGDQ